MRDFRSLLSQWYIFLPLIALLVLLNLATGQKFPGSDPPSPSPTPVNVPK